MRAVEQAPTQAAACAVLRTDIELPGAQRFIKRLLRDVHGALRAIKGLMPERFNGVEPTLLSVAAALPSSNSCCALMALRPLAAPYLAELPTPIGFNPRLNTVHITQPAHQHRPWRDPPHRLIEAGVTATP